MAWFKVDDTLPLNPKIRSCSLEAIGLWVLAGAWSSQQLTDGFVPKQMLQALLPFASNVASNAHTLAGELASAGLWILLPDGYQFHDWEDYNPDSQETKELRKKRREAGRKGGIKSGESRRSKSEASASTKPEATLEPRPVPSRPEVKNKQKGGEPEEFTHFYENVYPKKVDRQRALTAWKKVTKTVNPQLLIERAEAYKRLTAGKDKKYIKGPSSWLNAGSWDNEDLTQPKRYDPWEDMI